MFKDGIFVFYAIIVHITILNLFSTFVPGIEQELSNSANSSVTISFTPTLMPMIRGMQSTINVQMAPDVSVEDLKQQMTRFYENQEFVVVLPDNQATHKEHVQGSNCCHKNVFSDRILRRTIIISVIFPFKASFLLKKVLNL
ncbi:hypothetical protein LXL04_017446 [Taraxacum kok-saghyz]